MWHPPYFGAIDAVAPWCHCRQWTRFRFWTDDVVMTKSWFWSGVALTAVAVGGLATYFAAVGLDAADKAASVVGALVAAVGLAVSVYGLKSPPAGDRVSQKAKASGRGRTNQVGGDQGAYVEGAERHETSNESSQIEQRAEATDEGDVNQVGGDQRFVPPERK